MNEQDASMANTLALLSKLKEQMPEIWSDAEVVGKWVWIQFNIPPAKGVRTKLKELGFHWNPTRMCWQHPCGASRRSTSADPRGRYNVLPASSLELNDLASARTAKEYKIIALRECPVPEDLAMCDTPDKVASYWRLNVQTCPYFNADTETFVVLLLNTRRRVKGHQLISIGTLDTILVHPREAFRVAIIAATAAVVFAHSHPSGDPSPSEADIKVTRDLIRAGQLLKIDVLDHVIVAGDRHCSLRELGYFC